MAAEMDSICESCADFQRFLIVGKFDMLCFLSRQKLKSFKRTSNRTNIVRIIVDRAKVDRSNVGRDKDSRANVV